LFTYSPNGTLDSEDSVLGLALEWADQHTRAAFASGSSFAFHADITLRLTSQEVKAGAAGGQLALKTKRDAPKRVSLRKAGGLISAPD